LKPLIEQGPDLRRHLNSCRL